VLQCVRVVVAFPWLTNSEPRERTLEAAMTPTTTDRLVRVMPHTKMHVKRALQVLDHLLYM
jgi:hypothetical protein